MKWNIPENIKKNLEMYRKIRRAILSLCRELKEVSSTIEIDKVKGSSTEFPYTQRSYTLRGVSWKKMENIKNKIRIGEAQLREIEEFVDNIDDILVQQAVRKHYIRGDTWQKVSMDLMGSRNKSTSKMMVERYLKKL